MNAKLREGLWLLAGIGPVLALILLVIDAEHGLALTSIGSTAVLLFCFPQHEGSRPHAVVIAHLLGALIGMALLLSLGSHAWTMALGVALIAMAMRLGNIMHPPAGANPLIVLNLKPGWMFFLDPLLLALALILAGAWLWARLRKQFDP